jgi:hypothetical protein
MKTLAFKGYRLRIIQREGAESRKIENQNLVDSASLWRRRKRGFNLGAWRRYAWHPRTGRSLAVRFGATVVEEIDASREQCGANSLGMLTYRGRF